MAQSFSTNTGLSALPEYDQQKDPAAYAELLRIRNAIQVLQGAIDGLGGAGGVVVTHSGANFVSGQPIIAANNAGDTISMTSPETAGFVMTAQGAGNIPLWAAPVSPAIPIPLALDSYQLGLWEAWGIRRLLTSYTGPLVRVRRSSDNAVLDIGYTSNNQLDYVALQTFCAGTNGFVTTIYGQLALKNYVQATAANQPQIVSSGVYLRKIQFDGVSQYMSTTAVSSGANRYITNLLKGQLRALTGTPVIWEWNSGDASNSSVMFFDTAGSSITLLQSQAGVANSVFWASQKYSTIQVLANCYDRIVTSGALNGEKLGVQGVLDLTGSNSNVGALTGGFTLAKPYTIGARSAGPSNFSQLDFYACLTYEDEKLEDLAAISAAIQ